MTTDEFAGRLRNLVCEAEDAAEMIAELEEMAQAMRECEAE